MTIFVMMLVAISTVDNIMSQSISGFNHSIGDYYQGGIIFHLWFGEDNKEHGLITSLHNLDTNCVWGSDCSDVEEYEKNSYGPASLKDGSMNTNRIVRLKNHQYGAPKTCHDYEESGYNDWYMPSILELTLLLENSGIINRSAEKVGKHDKLVPALYMSSSDCADGYCFYLAANLDINYRISINTEHKKETGKNTFLRAIRRF